MIQEQTPSNKSAFEGVRTATPSPQELYFKISQSSNNIKDLLGKHLQDKTVSDRSKRRLLQNIGYQFPCAKLLKLWGASRQQ